jgi:DNA-binding MarR family transcriptional regulator
MNQIEDLKSCDPYQLIEALMQSGKFTETQLDAALATVGLSATKWNVLRQLVEAGGQLPLGQLATKLLCVKSNATQLVDRLEAEKLVRRVHDPEDRRSILAELTAEGQRCYTVGLKVVHNFERQLLDDYLPEERLLLHKLLSRLAGIASVSG